MEDTGHPDDRLSAVVGNCGDCGSSGLLLLRCDSCPVLELEYQRSRSSAGRLVDHLLTLEFDLKHGMEWKLDAEEEIGLRVLDQERVKYQNYKIEKTKQEQEMEKRVREAQARQHGRGGV